LKRLSKALLSKGIDAKVSKDDDASIDEGFHLEVEDFIDYVELIPIESISEKREIETKMLNKVI